MSLFKNKKGFSLAGWTEVALLSTLFVILIIGLIANFNVTYGGNYGSELTPLNTQLGSTQTALVNYQDTLQQSVSQGQASSSGLGMSLTTTWNIISAGANIMWNFLTGGYVEQLAGLLRFPTIVGFIFRMLFVISIGYIILKLVLRIKP